MMTATIELGCNRVLSALMTGVVQGLLLTVLVLLFLKVIPRMNAATRHAVGLLLLMLVFLLPVFHWWMSIHERAGTLSNLSVVSQEANTNEAERAKPLFRASRSAPRNPTESPSTTPAPMEAASVFSGPVNQPSVLNHEESISNLKSDDTETPIMAMSSLDQDGEMETPSAQEQQGHHAVSAVKLSGVPFTVIGLLHHWLFREAWNWRVLLPKFAGLLLVGAWLILAAIRLGSLGWQYRRLHLLKRRGDIPSGPLQDRVQALRDHLAIRRPVRLIECPEVVTPLVVGFRQPVILIPSQKSMEFSQMDYVLCHELAHIRRYDDWANLVQQVVKAMFFFHPAVCWLSHRLSIEREIACDDHVLLHLRNPKQYALLLIEFACRTHGRSWAVAPAAWSRKSQLKERVTMILNSKRNISPQPARTRVGIFATLATVVAALGLLAGPRLAFGQASSEASSSSNGVAAGPTATASDLQTGTAEGSASAAISHDDASAGSSIITAPRAVVRGPKPNVVLGDIPEAPAPPMAIIADGPAGPMAIAGPNVALVGPRKPMPRPAPPEVSVETGDREYRSIEKRLDRLERLVESLLAREKMQSGMSTTDESKQELKQRKAKEKSLKLDQEPKAGLSEEEITQMKEQAERGAKRAVQEARRAAQEAQRIAREAQRQALQQLHSRRAFEYDQRSLDTVRHQLEQQQQALQKQFDVLRKQLSQIKQEAKRLEQEKSRDQESGDNVEDDSKPSKDSLKQQDALDEEKKVKKP